MVELILNKGKHRYLFRSDNIKLLLEEITRQAASPEYDIDTHDAYSLHRLWDIGAKIFLKPQNNSSSDVTDTISFADPADEFTQNEYYNDDYFTIDALADGMRELTLHSEDYPDSEGFCLNYKWVEAQCILYTLADLVRLGFFNVDLFNRASVAVKRTYEFDLDKSSRIDLPGYLVTPTNCF